MPGIASGSGLSVVQDTSKTVIASSSSSSSSDVLNSANTDTRTVAVNVGAEDTTMTRRALETASGSDVVETNTSNTSFASLVISSAAVTAAEVDGVAEMDEVNQLIVEQQQGLQQATSELLRNVGSGLFF